MIKRDQYETIAECIRGEQMSAPEVAALFEDSKFYKWYKKEYNLDSREEETPQEEWVDGYKKWKNETCPHN